MTERADVARNRAFRAAALAAVFLAASLLELPAVTPSTGKASRPTVTCAFSNAGYSGWCRVTESIKKGATAGSVCRGVLTCLNDVRCTRTYCNATTIRGGWRLESAKTK